MTISTFIRKLKCQPFLFIGLLPIFAIFLWYSCKQIKIYSHLQDDWITSKPFSEHHKYIFIYIHTYILIHIYYNYVIIIIYIIIYINIYIYIYIYSGYYSLLSHFPLILSPSSIWGNGKEWIMLNIACYISMCGKTGNHNPND